MNIEIKKSTKLQELRVFVAAVVVAIALALATWIMQGLRTNLPFEAPILRAIVWVVIVGVAAAAVAMAWFQDRFKKYVLEGNKLTITSSYLGRGGNTQIITLNAKTISQLNLSQTMLGRKLDYGTITIEVDSFSKKDSYRLDHIDHPHQVLKALDAHVHKVGDK